MRNKQKGFSLIELLIVVAIILIIAAIAIPNLLRSKMAANEASAVGSLRTLNTACVTFSTTYGGYPSSLVTMGGEGTSALPTSTSAELIDNVLQTGIKTGYSFSFSAAAADSAGNVDSYIINAAPITPGVTGIRYFYTDQTGVIRANSAGAAATSSSTPIS
jgi:prepilin-type N-terminal cleavage/methylation domain-containing protein